MESHVRLALFCVVTGADANVCHSISLFIYLFVQNVKYYTIFPIISNQSQCLYYFYASEPSFFVILLVIIDFCQC